MWLWSTLLGFCRATKKLPRTVKNASDSYSRTANSLGYADFAGRNQAADEIFDHHDTAKLLLTIADNSKTQAGRSQALDHSIGRLIFFGLHDSSHIMRQLPVSVLFE